MIVTLEEHLSLSQYKELMDEKFAPTIVDGEITYPSDAVDIIDSIKQDPNWQANAATLLSDSIAQNQAILDAEDTIAEEGGVAAALAGLLKKDKAPVDPTLNQEVNHDGAILSWLQAAGWQGDAPKISKGSPLNFARTEATYFRINEFSQFESVTHAADEDFTFLVATSQGFLDTGFDNTDLTAGTDTYSQLWGYENLVTGNVEDWQGKGADTDDAARLAIFQNPETGQMAVLIPQAVEANVTTVVNFSFAREFIIPLALQDWKLCGFATLDEDAPDFGYIYKG